MKARVLPREEWDRLAGTEAGGPLPESARPVVIERDGQILACHVLMPLWHVEGLWVHPDHRKSTVGGRLWAAVKREAEAVGAAAVLTAALDDEVRALIAHVDGVKLPGEHYVIPVRG